MPNVLPGTCDRFVRSGQTAKKRVQCQLPGVDTTFAPRKLPDQEALPARLRAAGYKPPGEEMSRDSPGRRRHRKHAPARLLSMADALPQRGRLASEAHAGPALRAAGSGSGKVRVAPLHELPGQGTHLPRG